MNSTMGNFTKAPSSFVIIPAEMMRTISLVCYCGLVPIVAVIGIVGNSLTFPILLRQKPVTTTSIVLTALAVSDTFALISCIVFTFIRAAKIIEPPFGQWLSVRSIPIFENYLRGIPYRISNILTSVIAVERTVAVFIPLKIRTLWTKKVMYGCIAFAYMFVPSCMIPALLEYKNIVVEVMNTTVTILAHTEIGENEKFYDVYHTVEMVIFRLMTVCLVMVCNVTIIVGLCRPSPTRPTSSRDDSVAYRQELQVTKMLLLVTLIFFLCNVPGMLIYLMMNFDPVYRLPRIRNNGYILGLIVSLLLVTVNSSVNFLIYIATSERYREEYKRLVFCRQEPFKRENTTLLVQLSVIGDKPD